MAKEIVAIIGFIILSLAAIALITGLILKIKNNIKNIRRNNPGEKNND